MNINIKKIRIGVIFGGRSVEHSISIQSAKNIINNLNRIKYEIIPIKIDDEGVFHFGKELDPQSHDFLSDFEFKNCKFSSIPSNMMLPTIALKQFNTYVSSPIDVAFPVLHGTYGEDGAIQGLLKYLDIPFVGTDILGSAVSMDKDITKKLLKESGIACAKSITVHLIEKNRIKYDKIISYLGTPIFIKPSNLGSSIGISKVYSLEEFYQAIKIAFSYSDKIILEECIIGKEMECAVLGNEFPMSSVVGEIICKDNFYSYNAKYTDKTISTLKIPANISIQVSEEIRQIAIYIFKILHCAGMARIDFFLKNNNKILVNEINTIPGFTSSSMYPKLWYATGLPYNKLLDQLINLAIIRFNKNKTNNKLIKTILT